MPSVTNPVIIQSDRSVLLEVHNPLYEEARDTLAVFAELEKSPEYIHTYRITPLSLWNAASSGVNVADVLNGLERYSKFPLPDSVRTEIQQLMGRYGLVKLVRVGDKLFLAAEDPVILLEIMRHKEVKLLLAFGERERNDDSLNSSLTQVEINPEARGQLKQLLMKLFYPVEDLAGYIEGTLWSSHIPAPQSLGMHYTGTSCVYRFSSQIQRVCARIIQPHRRYRPRGGKTAQALGKTGHLPFTGSTGRKECGGTQKVFW